MVYVEYHYSFGNHFLMVYVEYHYSSLFLGNSFLMVYVEYHYSLETSFWWSMWNIIIPWKPLSDGQCGISLFIIIPWKPFSDGLYGISLFLGNPFLMVYVEYHYSLETPFRWSMWNIIIPWKTLSDGLCGISLFLGNPFLMVYVEYHYSSLFLGNPFLMVYVEYHYSLETPFWWSMCIIIIPWKPLSDSLCGLSLFLGNPFLMVYVDYLRSSIVMSFWFLTRILCLRLKQHAIQLLAISSWNMHYAVA